MLPLPATASRVQFAPVLLKVCTALHLALLFIYHTIAKALCLAGTFCYEAFFSLLKKKCTQAWLMADKYGSYSVTFP
jgi:hypothetical protein